MKKERKGYLVISVLLIAVMLLISLVTTLALVFDKTTEEGGIVEFQNVSILGDGNGSRLSLDLSKVTVSDGEIVFDVAKNPEHYLSVKPTNFTSDLFFRYRAYFSFKDEMLNIQYSEMLNI